MGALFSQLFAVGSKLTDRQVVCGLLVAVIGYGVFAHQQAMSKFDTIHDAIGDNARANAALAEKLDKTVDRFDRMQSLFMEHTLRQRDEATRQQRKLDEIERDTHRLKQRTGMIEAAPPPRSLDG